MRKTRRELPNSDQLLRGRPLHYSLFLTSSDSLRANLCLYKCKKKKSVILLDTINLGSEIDSSEKRKPQIVHYYNKTKTGVDTVDQMLRSLSTRSQTRRWPVAVFYNVLDMVLLNAWISFKLSRNDKNVSRRDFALCLIKQLCKVEPIQRPIQLSPSGDAIET